MEGEIRRVTKKRYKDQGLIQMEKVGYFCRKERNNGYRQRGQQQG